MADTAGPGQEVDSAITASVECPEVLFVDFPRRPIYPESVARKTINFDQSLVEETRSFNTQSLTPGACAHFQ